MKNAREPPWLVAVGASGPQGLDDLRSLLGGLSSPLEAAVLVVLHRLWDRPSHLKAVLARACRHRVTIAEEGETFEAGTVYIGEPSQHLTLLQRSFAALVQDPDRHYRNRTVDLLLKSVAEFGRGKVIGVVLSGALDDGSRGLAAIHDAGGLTMVVTPTAGQQGMPENAIEYDGPIDLVGSPEEIADAIASIVAGRGLGRGGDPT